MPRFRRRKLLRSSALIVFFVLMSGLLGLWFRPAFTPHINAERSVAELQSLRLGEFEQWILVRGHDVHNPVLLFLHGGPGMPAMYLAHAFQRELEHSFVVVHWDRLGAGKSYRDLGAAFLEQLEAPLKELIWFEESAHFPFLEEPEKFTAEILRVAARVGLQSTRRAN